MPQLREALITELRKGGPRTSEELVKKLLSSGYAARPEDVRKELASLVREGLIIKEPSPQRMKFVFKAKPSEQPTQ
ncbi:MAG: hypothetical protein J7L55_05060 [Desulfurococcales archaeon]|nr:hypothetical protein [Desulfurococcales archaeon]